MTGQRFDDGRWRAPAAERNQDPILDVLRRALPATGLVLEIASGTGQHVAHFAAALPDLDWQPSEADPAFHDSIRAWTAAAALTNVHPPIAFDVRQPWPVAHADAVICINMIHIAPWAATQALLDGGMCCRRAAYCFSTVRSGASAAIRPRATRRSTRNCAVPIRTGACAISKRSPRSPRLPGSR